MEDEIIISPELSHVPEAGPKRRRVGSEALLALPGVVQELEAVIEDKSGKAPVLNSCLQPLGESARRGRKPWRRNVGSM